MTDLSTLTLDDVAPVVGDAFAIELADGAAIELVLERATPAAAPPAAAPPPAARTPFVLAFAGPPEPQLAQQIVPLTHPTLGRLEIFLVPVAREPDGMRYEAVFA